MIAWALLFSFNITQLTIAPVTTVYAQPVLDLPNPGTLLTTTSPFDPPLLKGLTVHPENPLQFDFIVDKGETTLGEEALKPEYTKLIKYFLASLTMPKEDLWVNLSPYEKDRIVPDEFGKTEMGRDLLAQDYILKQLMASLSYPENGLGKKFWDEVYRKSYELYGTTNIPLNTFNKVWIVPDKAVVYVNKDMAFVVESHLAVMLEEDYLALSKNFKSQELGVNRLKEEDAQEISNLSSLIARDILIPAIEKEVNENQYFAQLRQIYNALILAAWYKKNLKENFLNKVYANQKKIEGVNADDPNIKQKIYEQYIEAFKKGVYNLIKEDQDSYTQQVIPRKYFSGGSNLSVVEDLETTESAETVSPEHIQKIEQLQARNRTVRLQGNYSLPEMMEEGDKAMLRSVGAQEIQLAIQDKMTQVINSISPSNDYEGLLAFITEIEKKENAYSRAVNVQSVVDDGARILELKGELEGQYKTFRALVGNYLKIRALRGTLAQTVLDQYLSKLNDLYATNMDLITVYTDLTWPGSRKDNKSFQRNHTAAESIWKAWQNISLDHVSDFRDVEDYQYHTELKRLSDFKKTRDERVIGSELRQRLNFTLRQRVYTQMKTKLFESMHELNQLFSSMAHAEALAVMMQKEWDEETIRSVMQVSPQEDWRDILEKKVRNFVRHYFPLTEEEKERFGQWAEKEKEQFGLQDILQGITRLVVTPQERKVLEKETGELLGGDFALARKNKAVVKLSKVVGLSVSVGVGGVWLYLANERSHLAQQIPSSVQKPITSSETPQENSAPQTEAAKETALEESQKLTGLMSLVEGSKVSDEVNRANKERAIQNVQAEIERLKKSAQEVEQKTTTVTADVQQSRQRIESDFNSKIEELRDLAGKHEGVSPHHVVPTEEKWYKLKATKEVKLASQEKKGQDESKVELKGDGGLRTVPTGHGGSDYSGLGTEWEANFESASPFLSLGSFTQVNYTNGYLVPRKSQPQVWSLKKQEVTREWVIQSSKGKSQLQLAVPPGYVIVGLETKELVEGTIYYDPVHQTWHLASEQNSKQVKVYVRKAKPRELPVYKQSLLLVNDQGQALSAAAIQTAFQKDFPKEMLDLFDLAKSLSLEEKLELRRMLLDLKIFYYTTNPYLTDVTKGMTLVQEMFFTLAHQCNGFASFNSILSFALGILEKEYAMDGYWDTNGSRFVTRGNGHNWNMSQGNVLNQPQIGESSPFYQKVGVTEAEWTREITEVILPRAQRLRALLPKMLEMITLRREQKKIETAIQAEEEKLKKVSEEKPARQDGEISPYYKDNQEYYFKLVAGYQEKITQLKRDTLTKETMATLIDWGSEFSRSLVRGAVAPQGKGGKGVETLLPSGQLKNILKGQPKDQSKSGALFVFYNPYELMAATDYALEMLSELNNKLWRFPAPDYPMMERIAQVKKDIFTAVKAFARQNNWELYEPLVMDPIRLQDGTLTDLADGGNAATPSYLIDRLNKDDNITDGNDLMTFDLRDTLVDFQKDLFLFKYEQDEQYSGGVRTRAAETGYHLKGKRSGQYKDRRIPALNLSLYNYPFPNEEWLAVGTDPNGKTFFLGPVAERERLNDLPTEVRKDLFLLPKNIFVLNGELLVWYRDSQGQYRLGGSYSEHHHLADRIFFTTTTLRQLPNGTVMFFGYENSRWKLFILDKTAVEEVDLDSVTQERVASVQEFAVYSDGRWATVLTYQSGLQGYFGTKVKQAGLFDPAERYKIARIPVETPQKGIIAAVEDQGGSYYIEFDSDVIEQISEIKNDQHLLGAENPIFFPNGSPAFLIQRRDRKWVWVSDRAGASTVLMRYPLNRVLGTASGASLEISNQHKTKDGRWVAEVALSKQPGVRDLDIPIPGVRGSFVILPNGEWFMRMPFKKVETAIQMGPAGSSTTTVEKNYVRLWGSWYESQRSHILATDEIFTNVFDPIFAVGPDGKADASRYLLLYSNDENGVIWKVKGPLAPYVGLSEQESYQLDAIPIQETADGQIVLNLVKMAPDGNILYNFSPVVNLFPRSHHFLNRVIALYNIPVSAVDANEHIPEERIDLRWEHFSRLVPAIDATLNSPNTLGAGNYTETWSYLGDLLMDMENDPNGRYFDPQRVAEILRSYKKIVAQLLFHYSDSSAQDIVSFNELKRYTDVLIDHGLHEVVVEILEELYKILLNKEAEKPASMTSAKDIVSLLTPQQWRNGIEAYEKFLQEQFKLDRRTKSIYLHKYHFEPSDHHRVDELNAFASIFLDDAAVNKLSGYGQRIDSLTQWIQDLNIPFQYSSVKAAPGLKDIFILLHQGLKGDRRNFDVEFTQETRSSLLYKMVKLIRGNTDRLKVNLAHPLASTEEYLQERRDWDWVNQRMTRMLGDDFNGPHNIGDVVTTLIEEAHHDAATLFVLAAFLTFVSSFFSDFLRRRNITLSQNPKKVVEQFIAENPWLEGWGEVEGIKDFLLEILKSGKLMTPEQEERLRSIRQQTSSNEDRMIIDAILALPFEYPAKSSMSLTAMGLIVDHLNGDTTIEPYRDRKKMTQAILDLVENIKAGKIPIKDFYPELRKIISRFSREETSLQEDLTPVAFQDLQSGLQNKKKDARKVMTDGKEIISSEYDGYVSKQTGAGVEFAGVREYRAGDDWRRITFASLASMDGPLQVKESQKETKVSAGILLDLRALNNADNLEQWTEQLANSLKVLYKKFRDGLSSGGDFQLKGLIVILPDGNLKEIKIDRTFQYLELANGIFKIVENNFPVAFQMFRMQMKAKQPEFYTAAEKKRYAQRTKGLWKGELSQQKLGQMQQRLKADNIYFVGVDESEHQSLVQSFPRSRSFYWKGQRAYSILPKDQDKTLEVLELEPGESVTAAADRALLKQSDIEHPESSGQDQIADKALLTAVKPPPGGIDLNPDNLDLQTQGEGMNLNFPLDPKNLEGVQINGLTPVILEITPVSNLPFLLGLGLLKTEQLSLTSERHN